MKTFNVKVIITIIILFQLSSCDIVDNVINQEPKSEFTSASFWQTPDDARSGLLGIYVSLRTTLNSQRAFLYWGEARSGRTIDASRGVVQEINDLANNRLDPAMSSASWANIYRTINLSNEALNNIPEIEMNEVERSKLLGEAHFIRALSYFYAVRVWGNVPLITDPVRGTEGLEIPQTDKQEVLDLIENDLSHAVANLPYSTDPSFATKGAAKALQAHVFAWIGNHQQAVDIAGEIINSGNYSLLPGSSYGDLFEVENTVEAILELNFNANIPGEGAGFAGQFAPAALGGGGSAIRESPQLDFMRNLFTEGDHRLNYIIRDMENNSGWDVLIGDSPIMIGKYRDRLNDAGQPSLAGNNIIVYRLPDIILLKAESMVQLGNESRAIQLLETIRARAYNILDNNGNIDTSSTLYEEHVKFNGNNLLDEIIEERLKELIWEGHYWFDLRRNNMTNIVGVTGEQVYWPVHQDALDFNSALTQNPGY